jgi:type II secretory pathway pseudopilin PulG
MKFKSAYSLIEIAIVIIIITFLMVGAMNGLDIIRKTRLINARNLTEQSVVPKIKNLITWYETCLDNSFIEGQRDDGSKISIWNDINPSRLIANNASQTTPANQPTLFFKRFNGAIPGLFFDGGDFFNYLGRDLINSSYSIFIVEKRMNGGELLTMIGGASTAVNSNLILSYRSNTAITQAHYGNDIDIAVPGYSSPVTRIHSFLFNKSFGKKYWLNGGENPDGANASQTSALIAYDNAWIGRYISYFYYGDIAEIIFYNRSLTNIERRSVENYLSQKYGIAIQ